jgi:hypothetical protein
MLCFWRFLYFEGCDGTHHPSPIPLDHWVESLPKIGGYVAAIQLCRFYVFLDFSSSLLVGWIVQEPGQ